jgi:hypothetical protein
MCLSVPVCVCLCLFGWLRVFLCTMCLSVSGCVWLCLFESFCGGTAYRTQILLALSLSLSLARSLTKFSQFN